MIGNSNTGVNSDNYLLNSMYGYYVKYDRLERLISYGDLGSSDAEDVTVFVDIYDIVKSVTNFMSIPGSPSPNNKLFITTGLINLCAHYRLFFKRHYNVHAKFWFVCSTGQSMHSKINPEYSRFPNMLENPIHNDILQANLDILSTLVPYLPDIDIKISNQVDTSVIIAALIEKQNTPNIPSIVISKDPYLNILPSMIPNTFLLRPKKSKQEDISYISSYNTCAAFYMSEVYKKNVNAQSNIKAYHNSILSLVMTLGKVPNRSLRTIYRIDKTFTILDSIIQPFYNTDIVLNSDNVIQRSNGILIPYESRYRSINVLYMLEAFKYTSEYLTYNDMVNLYDPTSVQRINETYFYNIPLDLEAL